jgi:ribosomal protein S18 acetylase RimI-like enzyme
VVEVRAATVEDADAMAEVNAAGWREGYRGIVPDSRRNNLPVGRWRREMRAGLEAPRGRSFTRIAELGGEFAGYCFVAAPGREEPEDSAVCELAALYVDPGVWRRGVGSALVQSAIAEAAARGGEEMLLWTFQENERALAFYRAAGFLEDGGRRPYVPIGAPTVRLRRSLA